MTTCASGRVATPSPGDPADLGIFGAAQIDLFASPDSTHCQLFYSCLVPGWDAEVLGDLPQSVVVDTITSARSPSTRHFYALKWNLFIDWCSSQWEDPRRCPVRVVLSFLQEGLERRLFTSTLKVYVAAIATHHDAVDGESLGKHDVVVRFRRGVRRLNPSHPTLGPVSGAHGTAETSL